MLKGSIPMGRHPPSMGACNVAVEGSLVLGGEDEPLGGNDHSTIGGSHTHEGDELVVGHGRAAIASISAHLVAFPPR